MTRKSAIRTLAALATAGVLAAGTGAALAATNSPNKVWGGMMGGTGNTSMMGTVADYLGLTSSELLTRLRGGSSLIEVAASQGKSVSGLKDVMLQAMKEYLDGTSLTAAQKSSMISHMRGSLMAMLNAQHSPSSGNSGFRGMMSSNWGNSY